MIKQVEIHGQRFELYSPDDGWTWSSSPQSIVSYRRRRKSLRAELQKRLELIRTSEEFGANRLSGLGSELVISRQEH